ncbi:MAG: esterase-like activity of phytase family protein [Leadbetterella sp.]|nr:esterase-like activity of phytase family protein [Leadbetterella sp.]
MRLLFLIGFLLPASAYGQSLKGFEITKADSVFVIDSTHWHTFPANLRFGGISGLEMTETGELLLVSDRQTPSPDPENQDSWLYRMDTLGNIRSTSRFFGVRNVEALRLDTTRQKIWYSFENDESTGVGYIDSDGTPVTAAEHSMITSPFTTLNRGIEGLAVAEDLWYAFEAGPDSTVLIRWPEREKVKAETYTYPLDKSSCLSPQQPAGSSLGNGISEILAVPGEKDKLLVLERCFNGRYSYIKLFESKISARLLEKREVFSWTPGTLFNGLPLKPDNMEGMAWGKPVNGRRTLYLISDDNHNPRYQRTLLLKLIEQ